MSRALWPSIDPFAARELRIHAAVASITIGDLMSLEGPICQWIGLESQWKVYSKPWSPTKRAFQCKTSAV